MKAILKLELNKAFKNPLLLFSIILGSILVLLSAIHVINGFNDEFSTKNLVEEVNRTGKLVEIQADSYTLYNKWIGAEMTSQVSIAFFYLLPLLAMLPCGFSLGSEINSGYTKHIIPHCGRKNYIFAKYISAFITGGFVTSALLLLSVLIVAAFIPAIAPKVFNTMFYPIMHGNVLSKTAFQNPLLFIFSYIGIDIIFGGLFACMPLTATFIFRKPISAVVSSYILVLVCDMIRSFFLYIFFIEISPINLMHAIPPLNESRFYMVALWYGIFIVLSLPYGIYKGVKYEII